MGTIAHVKFMQGYVQLALEYKVPPMIFRWDAEGWRRATAQNNGAALDDTAIALAVQMVHALEEMGVPLLDEIYQLPLDADPDSRMEQAVRILDNLKPGITHFAIHAAKDTPELRAIASDWACRVADYQTFMRTELRDRIQDMGLHVIGYRALQTLMEA
jgi:hypothetical protein